ncbi:MAG: hypothetical protein PHR43_05480 [Dehalococcoidales bacterium]|nr:hypothetical protein [Dehalococcoidales bacterium]
MSVFIEIYPQLDACIETQAKRLYKEYSERILGGEYGVVVDKVEILRLFLETWNFNKLRAESEPHLVAGKKIKYTVWVENGKSEYEMKIEQE